MSEQFTPPSRRSVFLSVLAAIVLASVLLVAVVLPAEYDIDPTGIGAALGIDVLTGVHNAIPDVISSENLAPPPAPRPPPADEAELLPQPPEEIPGLPVPAPLRDPAVVQRPGSEPRSEVIHVALALGEEVEMKAVLGNAQAMVYSWSINDGEVYYDFHAEPEQGPEGYFVRYAEGEGSTDSGSLVAPFAGHHGWYWLNISDHPITIHLEVTGYHKELVEVHRGTQGF